MCASRTDAMTDPAGEHWDDVYTTRATDSVSWFQARPAISLRLLEAFGETAGSVIDVGAGASTLVDELLARGWIDVTVLDVSNEALELVRTRLAISGLAATAVTGDLLSWEPERTYDVWHDRAVLHFLTQPEDRARYVETAARVVRPGGHLAEDGPTRCSGLTTARYSADELASLFNDSFEPVHAEREEHHTPDGTPQSFTWAVLRRR
jgi:2-polyprenyl-3-methyl-5-hydroxy-6-metoxy-1,4-benzoquinol methylase